MGQRHQAWIIARVKPHGGGQPRYRCIGGLQHQWCYGSLPILGVIRMTTILKQESNAQVVLEELRRIEGKYGSYMAEEPKIPDLPCPYTSFVWNLAFNADLDPTSLGRNYFSSGSPNNHLPASWGCWDGDDINNDGLTIIDVTDPRNPKYCLLCGKRRLINAEQYLTIYYNIEDEEAPMQSHHRHLINATAHIPLIDTAALGEVWPSIFKGSKSSTSSTVEEQIEDTVPSLASLTLGPAVKQAAASEANIDALERLLTQEDKLPAVWNVLRTIEAPFPETGLSLIARILRPADMQDDLRGVQLSGEQLTKVIPADAELDKLDLTGNAALDAAGLRTLLTHVSKIRRLVLIRTSVSDDDLFDMLDTAGTTLLRHVEELVHPLLHSWRPDAFPAAFTAVHFDHYPWASVSVPLLSARLLTQNLACFVRALLSDVNDFSYGNIKRIALEAALSAGRIPEGTPWAARPIWCTPAPSSRLPTDRGGWRLTIRWSFAYGAHPRQYGLFHARKNQDGTEMVTAHTPESFLSELQVQGYPAPGEDVVRSFLAIFDQLKNAGAAQMTIDQYVQLVQDPSCWRA
ncbi:hypothetical protein C8Q77DRAFT_451807 [Trametes polyzona]|nr:hypothetical protein C8Q77DRAFT_451807 [Trametes polyzona]